MGIKYNRIFIVLISFCLSLSSCTGMQAATPTSPAPLPPTSSPKPTAIPTASPSPIPLPALTLVPGDSYFSINGRPAFLFSRNIAGNQESTYGTLLDWSVTGGSRIARVLLVCLGPGFTSSGGVDEVWARQWERIFDRAAVEGIYVLPVLTGWGQWDTNNTEAGWLSNPFNAANGGPTQDPLEIFQAGSET